MHIIYILRSSIIEDIQSVYILFETDPGAHTPRPNRFQTEETSAQNGAENGRRTHCSNSAFGRPWGSTVFYLNGFSVFWSSIWSKNSVFFWGGGGRAAPLFLNEKPFSTEPDQIEATKPWALVTLLDDFSSVATPCTAPRSHTQYIYGSITARTMPRTGKKGRGAYIYMTWLYPQLFTCGVLSHIETLYMLPHH